MFDANAWYLVSNEYGNIAIIDTDTTIASDTPITRAQRIYVTEPVSLINYGIIDKDIYICDACHVSIINHGDIRSNIHIGNNANLTQIIETPDNLAPLTTNDAYSVLIRNANGIYWHDITDAQWGASEITITNSVIIVDTAPRIASRTITPQTKFIGDNQIVLHTNNATVGHAIPIMPANDIDAALTITIPGLNKLYRVAAYNENEYLYAKILRETDYMKIFNDDRGRFLNRIQSANPDDKFIRHLNRATDMDGLYNIMNKSIRFHPEILLGPIKTLNQYMAARQFRIINPDGEMTIAPFMIYDNATSVMYGLRGEIAHAATTRHDINIGIYGGVLKYDNNLDTAGGAFYGGDIGITSTDKQIYWNINSGITGAKIKTPELFTGANTITPIAVHANANIGPTINLNDKMTLIPFAGLSASYGHINNESEIKISPRIGGDVKYKFAVTDIEYAYHLHADIDTDGQSTISIGIMGASPMDQMAIGFDAGIIHNECATSYTASITGKLYF